MKKSVIVFGLIAGFILAAVMIYSTAMCYKNPDFESNMILGYASMIIAFSFIFVAVKNFRDKYNNGLITFGRAFLIGIYITLIASSMYVVIWMIEYYIFIPDFIDTYTTHVIKEAKAGGATQLELNKQMTEMTNYKKLYENPVFVVLITYSEVLPVGVIISLISALILKRKEKNI